MTIKVKIKLIADVGDGLEEEVVCSGFRFSVSLISITVQQHIQFWAATLTLAHETWIVYILLGRKSIDLGAFDC